MSFLKHVFFILFIFCTLIGHGQTLDEAKAQYNSGQYQSALSLFNNLYEKKPEDASINFYLGMIAYKSGDYKNAEKHLALASTKNFAEAYIYLGELYAKYYRFDDATKEFNKYQKAKRKDKEAISLLETKKNEVAEIQRMIRQTEDIQIIDSIVLPKSIFLSAYTLSKSSGSLLPLYRFIKSYPDDGSILFLNEKKDKVYYSKHRDDYGSKIFSMEKLMTEFGNEKPLPASINKEGNQAYPFVMPDGLTLYFASTKDDLSGDYDLFITRYNLGSNTYLLPSKLNPPFNSPFNDYMMAIDEENGVGWFASDRFQDKDNVCVYTFIPESKTVLIEDENINLANRAIISSIRDSWRQGVDYAQIVNRIKQKNSEKEIKSDFIFVINDAMIYHNLSDFKNDKARNLYSKVIDYRTQLKQKQDELYTKRKQFGLNGDNAGLRSSIVDLEKKTESLYCEIERMSVIVRNIEINYKNHQ